MEPPGPYLQTSVWETVCTIYLHCCARAGRTLYSRRDASDSLPPVEAVAREARENFQTLLRQFVSDISALPGPCQALTKRLTMADRLLPRGASLPFVRAGDTPNSLWCPLH